MGQQGKRRDEEPQAGEMLVCGAVAVVVFALIFWLMVSIMPEPPRRDHADYMVSITDVDGLNLEATSGGVSMMLFFLRSRLAVPTMLSPVFNLTVGIDNPGNTRYSACVWGLSTVAVSYGDAFLARGSAPPFCAEEKEVQERVAMAWGEDVVLPRFLHERLSAELERGEASLDVQVTMPGGCSGCSDIVLVCSKVKIGGSSSPCRVERARPMPLPAAGSASTN